MKLKHCIVLFIFFAFAARAGAIESADNLFPPVPIAKEKKEEDKPKTQTAQKVKTVESFIIQPVLPHMPQSGSRNTANTKVISTIDSNEIFLDLKHTPSSSKNQRENLKELYIKSIIVEGAEILTEDEIKSVSSRFEGKILSFEEIKRIPEEINKLYRNYRIFTAFAYIPAQDISGDTLKIRVLEGKIGKIKVTGNKTTNESYIRHAITQKEGDIIFTPEIEKEIIKFNKYSDVKLSANITKGSELGTSDIELRIKEPDSQSLNVTFTNTGTKNTGIYKTGININNDSLFGIQDRFMAGYEVSRGIDSYYAGCSFPLNYSGLRFGAMATKGFSSVIEAQYKELDIKAKSKSYSLYLSKPLISSRKLYVSADTSLNFKNSETMLLGSPLEELGYDPIPRITESKNSLTAVINDRFGQWVQNSNLHFGMDILGGEDRFFKYTGSIQRYTFIGKDYLLILKTSTQLATKQLPTLEKYQIGGSDTVRGYPESYSVADAGFVVNAELRYPLYFIPQKIGDFELRKRFQGTVFWDTGRNYYKDKTGTNPVKLMGLGTGVIFRISDYLSGRVDYSWGLTNREADMHPSRVTFNLSSTPF